MTLREVVRSVLAEKGVIHPEDGTVTCWRTAECEFHTTCVTAVEEPSSAIVEALVVAVCKHVTDMLEEELPQEGER